MAWREALLHYFGLGLLGGVTAGDWLKLLRDNRFAIAPSCLPRALAISFQSLQISALRRFENWRYGPRLTDVNVEPPLFLLGHWRSGTTHLHNLMTLDSRFAYPNNYQTFLPHVFLSTEAFASQWIEPFLPKRRPMDNIEWDMRSPQEDEFALAVTTGESPCMGWAFPRRQEYYDRYLTFRGVPEDEVARWRAAFILFLKKLTWKYRRPLILKSPPHTARIRLLLDLFPRAKFVHIRRNPYAVFPSSRWTFRVVGEMHRLQRPRPDPFDDWVLRQYRAMYEAYFEERSLIPAGNLVEIGYEELVKDPLGQLRHVYETLGLPEFDSVEPAIRRYVDSIAGYQKNTFPELSPDLRDRIAREWRPCFEAWGYPV